MHSYRRYNIFVTINCFLLQILARLFPKFLQRKMLPTKKVNKCTSTPTCLIFYMHTLKYPKELLKTFFLLLHVLSNVSLLKIDCHII